MHPTQRNRSDRQTIALLHTCLRGGGVERSMLRLAQGLTNQGWSVDLVVCSASGPLQREIPEDVHLIDLGAHRIAAAAPGLIRYLRRTPPTAMISAISTTNCMAVWARRLLRQTFPLVVTEHTTPSMAARGAKNLRARLVPTLMRHSYPKADGIVAVSDGVADDLARTAKLPRGSIEVIHNPVVTETLKRLARAPLDHPWFRPGHRPVIVAIGRLTRAKDFPTLLHAFARVRTTHSARLIILGEGEERGSLERLANELGVTEYTRLPGFTHNPYQYLARADLFVLSSRWEGLPTVLIEAMACGTPVVATDCPSGPAEILENGRWGQLVPVGQPSRLAAAMARVIDGRCKTTLATQRADMYSAECATERYVDKLARVIARHQG